MSSYKPRVSIPDEWATNGTCPICDRKSLWVERTMGEPDRLSCTGCEASFEMEIDGPHIRLVVLPPEYAVYIQPAWETWMTAYEIRQQIKSPAAAIGTRNTPANPAHQSRLSSYSENSENSLFEDEGYFEPLSQEDINSRALGFESLGNSPQEIRTILTSIRAKPEQIEQALALVSKKDKAKHKNYPRNIMLVLIIIILCLGGSALILPLLKIPQYLASFQPVLNVFQKSFNPDYEVVETATLSPNQEVFYLPSDGQAYFDIVINLDGKYRDKAVYMANSYPPTDLYNLNLEIVRRYQEIGQIELDYENGLADYEEKCGGLGIFAVDTCNKINSSNSNKKMELLAKQTELSDYWATSVCSEFRHYYDRYNVIWPFGINMCPAP